MNLQSWLLLLVILLVALGILRILLRNHRAQRGGCTHCDQQHCPFRSKKE
ncbi:MAG: hypothetical protein ILA34_05360 [Bacteroidaceae bacterium]|nr:hypothetical protein [Bacteroidaceae bacterium]